MLTLFKIVGLSLIVGQFLCSVTALLIVANAGRRIARELGSRMNRDDYWRVVSRAMIPGSHWQELVEVSEIGQVEQYRRKMKVAVLLLVAPAVAYLAVIGALEIWLAVCA